MTVLAAAPGHAILLRIGAHTVRVRDTFELSLRLEEKFGRLFELASRRRAEWPLADMAKLYGVLLNGMDVTAAEISEHISELGLIKAWAEIEQVFAVIINGWDALSEEAATSSAANPPPERRKPGPKPGSKRKPKDSPGAISSEPPACSASGLPNSGPLLHSSSPPSGGQPPAAADLLGGMAPPATNGAGHRPTT